MNPIELNIPLIAIQFALLLLALTVHECAHAWTASRFGDPTARQLGRVSLNPLAHIDPIGTVIFPLMGMVAPGLPVLGWAKPVPVDPTNLRRPRWMGLWISAAGPLSNILLGLGLLMTLALLARAGIVATSPNLFDIRADMAVSPVVAALKAGFLLNVVLAFFNLLPVPPLDGSGVLRGLLPESLAAGLDGFARMGFLVLLAMMVIPVRGVSLLGWLLLPVYLVAQGLFRVALWA